MSAVVFRRSNLKEVLDVFDETKFLVNWHATGRQVCRSINKFSKTKPKTNFVLTRLLGRKPVRTAHICFYKPELENTHIRQNHGNEYNYLLKFLIERISWIARDAPTHGDGICDLVMSTQQMYDTEDILAYIDKLRRATSGRYNTRANWRHVGEVSEMPHLNETETHLADIAASAFHLALEPKLYGMTDDRMFMNLRKTVYRGRNDAPHGVKIWPESCKDPERRHGRMRFIDSL